MAKLKWSPVRVKLGQIKAWDGNPRMSTKAQAQRIIKSEQQFGQPIPFILNPLKDGMYPLLDGHQRLSAWLTVYGEEYEMDAMVAGRELTEAEHRELVITLHTGATGEWNWQTLSGWNAGELKEWGMNADTLKQWNNDANNLKEMIAAQDLTEEIGFGDAPEGVNVTNQYGVIVICADEAEQEATYNALLGEGYKVKVVVV